MEGLELSLPPLVRRGEEAVFTAKVRPFGGAVPATHVLVTKVYDPSGQPRSWYGGNLDAPAGAADGAFRPALDDPAGRWRLVVRDVASGIEAQGYLEVE